MFKSLKRKLSNKSASRSRSNSKDSRPSISAPIPVTHTNVPTANGYHIQSPQTLTANGSNNQVPYFNTKQSGNNVTPMQIPKVPPSPPTPLRSILRQTNSDHSSDSEASESTASSGSQRSVAFLDETVIRQERLQQLSNSINETLRNSGNMGIQRRSFTNVDPDPVPDYPKSPTDKFDLRSTRNQISVDPTSTFQPKVRSQPIGRPKKSRAPTPPGLSLESIQENGSLLHSSAKKTQAPLPPGQNRLSQFQFHQHDFDTRTLTPGSSTETLHSQQSIFRDSSNLNPIVEPLAVSPPLPMRERGDGDSQDNESTSSGSTSKERQNHKTEELDRIVVMDSRKLKANSGYPFQEQARQTPKTCFIVDTPNNDSSIKLECKTFEPYVHSAPIIAPLNRLRHLQNNFVTLPSRPQAPQTYFSGSDSIQFQKEQIQPQLLADRPIHLFPQQTPQKPLNAAPPTTHQAPKKSSSISKAFKFLSLSAKGKTRKPIGSTFELSSKKGKEVYTNGLGGSACDLSSVEMSSLEMEKPKRSISGPGKSRSLSQDPWHHVASRSHENLHSVNPMYLERNQPMSGHPYFNSFEQSPRAAAVTENQYLQTQPRHDNLNNSQCIRSASFSTQRNMYSIS